MRLLLLLLLCAASYAQTPGVRGAFRGTLSAPVTSGTPQYDLHETTFTATTSGVNTLYLQDLTTYTVTYTAPGGSCVRGDGVTVTTLAVLGFLYSNSGAAATWHSRAALPCAGVWTFAGSGTDGTTTWSTGTTPATPSGSVTVVSSSNDGFLRTSGRKFITERTASPAVLIGAAQDPTASSPHLWSVGGAGAAGADVDGTGSDALYFGAMGTAGAKIFRNVVGGTHGGLDVSTFNNDGAGHNLYDLSGQGVAWDATIAAAHLAGLHYWRVFQNASSSSWATSGASYTAIQNGIRYAIARYGWATDLWEIANEQSGITQAFITSIRAYILSLDPYAHPIGTSYPLTATPAGLTGLDYITPHDYTNNSSVTSWFTGIESMYDTDRGNYALPVISGESGVGTTLNNDDGAPWRWLGLMLIGGVKGAGNAVWDISYTHPVSGLGGIYVGTAARAIAPNVRAAWAAFNPTDVPPGTISAGGTGNILVRGASSTSGNADIIGFVADTVSFGGSHPGTSTITMTFQTSGMTLGWFDPQTGASLGTSSPASGAQTTTIPAFTGMALWRACVHGNSGCPL